MSDESEKIDQVLAGRPAEILTMVAALRSLVRQAAPSLAEEGKVGWNNITYKGRKGVCAIAPHSQSVNLYFYQGTSLPDPQGLLAGSGKALRHLRFGRVEEIRPELVQPFLAEALRIDAGN